ncbi:MAG TPA: ATP-binding protein [Micromonosporaceae bacterium]
MGTVRLAFTPAPAHVRTARLVGVAVARRAGVADAIIDEVRLAIGEACSRAVALHRRHSLTDLVEVELIADAQFTVRVTDHAPRRVPGSLDADDDPERTDPIALLLGPATTNGGGESGVSDEDVAVGVSLTLLAGLVEDLAVIPSPDGIGSQVCMSWPAGRSR